MAIKLKLAGEPVRKLKIKSDLNDVNGPVFGTAHSIYARTQMLLVCCKHAHQIHLESGAP